MLYTGTQIGKGSFLNTRVVNSTAHGGAAENGETLMALDSKQSARLANLFDKAVQLFEGDVPRAQTWLRTPNKALGNQAPLALAETEAGVRAVEDLIGRLEHGVYS
jgi:putative toxin-antitoxin system antitoxin component (TIGR02293 family)